MKIFTSAALVASAALLGVTDAQGCSQCATGFTTEVPGIVWSSAQCDNYDPSKVDWLAFRDDVKKQLGQGGNIGPDRIPFRRVAPMLIRSAFHDSGSFRNGVGGADGSMVLAPVEQTWQANSLPMQFVPYVKATLWHLVEKYQISWADAIAVAGAAAIEFMGATNGFRLRVGRCDSNVANPEVLPASNMRCNQFQDYWTSVGMSVTEGLALVGSHSVADTTNRMAASDHRWSNSLFTDALTGSIQVQLTGNPNAPEAVAWSQGVWRYTVNDAFDAPQNSAQGCPFNQQFTTATNTFATSRKAWDDNFAAAYKKMTEIGARFSKNAKNVVV